MTGNDGNRGYLIQTLIAMLDSLRIAQWGWEQVTIEPSHEDEIVDIVWNSGNNRICKQVKSSINQFRLPEVKKWAEQLQERCNADELALVLVGSASDGVIKIGRIGRVSVPRPKNLDWEGLISEASHLLDTFLFSIGLASSSPVQSRVIAKSLVTELSIYASESKTLEREELVKTLRSWIEAISPDGIVSLHQSVLSKSPRSVRSNIGSKLIGRENEARWLRETTGDKLVIGQPGIGKTFLLCDYVREEGSSYFLRSNDKVMIERAIRVLSPSSIVIEDAQIYLDAVEFLRRLRVDSNLSFSIVADCWPGSRDNLIDKLGVRSQACLELERVTDQEIVDIIREFGINPSNSFLQMVVWQSSGFPGRAAMLVNTCLGGTHEDYENFWNGETLARWVRTRFTDLIGKEAIQVLACFAMGGASGVATELVARVLQLPLARVLEIVTGLSLGGVVADLSSGRIAVVPSRIRAILVRDSFFRIAGIPIDEFLNDRAAFSDVVTTIANASALGSDFPNERLRELVRESNDPSSWAALIHTSAENARHVIDEKNELLPILANDFLQTVPDRAIPELLRQADGDFRPLSSNADHPLRKLTDWVKSGFPTREALPRRKSVFEALRTSSNESINLALRLLPIVVSPEYVNLEQNPGNRLEHTLLSGCLAIEDLQGIAGFWAEILDILRYTRFTNWESVLEATSEWLRPHFAGGAKFSDDQREVIKTSALTILPTLAEMAVDRPGVLRKLDRIAGFHGVELSYSIPYCYEALFPVEPSYDGGYEQYQSKFADLVARAREQGLELAKATPEDVIVKVSHWTEEAKLSGRPWPDLCLPCFESISAKVPAQLPWVQSILDLDGRGDLLAPFMRRAIDVNETGWDECLNRCLGSERCLVTAMEIALTHPRCTNDHVVRAISEGSKAIESLRKTVMLHALDDKIICSLLKAKDARVVSVTLEGIWHKLKKAPRKASWYDEWRRAVIEYLDDSYCLNGALSDDALLRHEWIAYLASSASDNRRFQLDAIEMVTSLMSNENRSELIEKVIPEARNAKQLILALVGTSVQRYEILLHKQELKKFWSTPLQREPDKTWNAFAIKALECGISVQTIVDQTRIVLNQFGPVPQKFYDEIAKLTSSLEFVDPQVRIVVEAGLEAVRGELKSWERWERERNH